MSQANSLAHANVFKNYRAVIFSNSRIVQSEFTLNYTHVKRLHSVKAKSTNYISLHAARFSPFFFCSLSVWPVENFDFWVSAR